MGLKVRSIGKGFVSLAWLCYGHFSRWCRFPKKNLQNPFWLYYVSFEEEKVYPAINFFHKEILKYNEVSQFHLVILNRSAETFVRKTV